MVFQLTGFIFLFSSREILGDKFDNQSLLNILFKQLNHSSVLFVLNETKLLRTLQYKEVVDLLYQQTEIHESYKSASSQHISTYLCFTIIKKYTALSLASKIGTFVNDSNTEVDFTEDVLTENMTELKKNIEEIDNSTEKVEVLENIFSLLFIRSSDFKGCEREDIDFDNIEDSSRDSSMSQSFESNFDEESENTIQKEVKKAQRSLIFGLTDGTKEKKLISNDDINQSLLQEIQDGSSSDTLKAKENHNSLEKIQDMPPSFLASSDLIRQTLALLGDSLVSLSVEQFSANKGNM